MKKIIIPILLVLLTVCFAASGIISADGGTTYYVDSELGNDANTGTSEAEAWKTLKKASSVTYSAGDKILLKAGSMFTDTFYAKGSGTEASPITVSSYGELKGTKKPFIYTSYDTCLMELYNTNNWIVEDIEFAAPNGSGLKITNSAAFGEMTGITVSDCIFHDIYTVKTDDVMWERAPIVVKGQGNDGAPIKNVTISDVYIYDSGHGIYVSGGNRLPANFDSFETTLNSNITIENVSMRDINYDGIFLNGVYDSVVRNCSLLRVSMEDNRYIAPLWLAHSANVLVEKCEVAGSGNDHDGMAIDFDNRTSDSTYQYIYSHDNNKFISSCPYDGEETKNANNTVRYCLSVNDNKIENHMASNSAIESTADDPNVYMDNFKFYNNTIINGSSFIMDDLRNAYIANNIFIMKNSSQKFETHNSTGNYDFTGTITNNYFKNVSSYRLPTGHVNSVTSGEAGFIGSRNENKDSFMLSSSSQLLGKGAAISGLDITEDFYGNALTAAANIGCYGGTGEAALYDIVVEWGTFNFSYSRTAVAEWDPQSMTYTSNAQGTWTQDRNATVSVTNYSTVAVDVEFEFDAIEDTVVGTMSTPTATVASGSNVQSTLTLSGSAAKGTNSLVKLGLLYVRIS